MKSLFLYFKLNLRFINDHLAQYSLLVLSLLIGIVGYSLIDALITNSKQNLKQSFAQVHNKGTHILSGYSGFILPEQYVTVKKQMGFEYAFPVIEAKAKVGEDDVQIIGLDLTDSKAIQFQQNIKRLKQTNSNQNILQIQNGVLLSPKLEKVFRADGDLTLQIKQKQIKISPFAVIQDPLYQNARVIIADLSSVSDWLDNNQISKIVIDSPGLSQDTIQQLNTMGFMVKSKPEQMAVKQQLTRSLYINLTAASLITLLVSFSLIFSSLHFIQSQKHPLIKQLLDLGVYPKQIKLWIWLEVIFLVLVAYAICLILASGIAPKLSPIFSQLINNHYYFNPQAGVKIYPVTLVRTLILTLLALTLANLISIRQGYNILQQKRPKLFKLGLMILIALICLFLIWQFKATGIVGGFIGIACLLLVFASLTPMLSKWILNLLYQFKSGSIFTLAYHNLRDRLNNIYIAVVSLSITLILLIGLSTMLYSFRQNVIQWLDQRLTSDFYVADPSEHLNPTIFIQELLKINNIDSISSYSNRNIDFNNKQVQLVVADLTPKSQLGYQFIHPINAEIWGRFHDGQGVFISESLAHHHKLELQQRFSLETKHKHEPISVINIYKDFGTEQGTILMSSNLHQKLFEHLQIDNLGIHLKDKAIKPETLERVKQTYPDAKLWQKKDIMNLSLDVFDNTFSILNVVRLLLIGVGLLGLLSAFLVLQYQQAILQRILAVLGVFKQEVLLLYCLQSGFIGLISLIISIPGGLICGWLLLNLIHVRAFGWQIQYHIPVFEIAMFCLAVWGLMIIIGLLPGLVHYRNQREVILHHESL